MLSNSIWPIDRTLSGVTTPGQRGPGSNGIERVLCILQSSSITGASPWDCFVSYPGHSLGESYPSAEMQSVYSTVPNDWATEEIELVFPVRISFISQTDLFENCQIEILETMLLYANYLDQELLLKAIIFTKIIFLIITWSNW